MSDRYAVVGNPVAHSRSPSIHAQFAAQTGQDLVYERLLAPLDGFVATVEAFRASGGRGLNVTVPFKLEAFAFAQRRTARATMAGAVNTLRFDADGVFGDNTDGIGLVRDITVRLGQGLGDASVLLLGAGGAARGVLQPLLDAGVRALTVANRTVSRAEDLARLAGDARVRACGFDLPADAQARVRAGLPERFDLIVNATSAGLDDAAPAIPAALYPTARLCYDMVYGARPTAFMTAAAAAGCAATADGLGMLVEQAAESFLLWRGVRPVTEPVYRRLRAELAGH
ncbi:MAG TPA: shikimate dehydrogenase [Quisquiliibacterium sp.]|nr:shikimate dehydrogenase [Quisquiliibacterium sp.]HQD82914.1 shikimate dehydrogenase [Quisquiliibacterium sp.]